MGLKWVNVYNVSNIGSFKAVIGNGCRSNNSETNKNKCLCNQQI